MSGLALLGKGRHDRIVLGKALDGENLMALGLHRENHARQNGPAVHDDRTGAAGPVVTHLFQAGQAEAFSQHLGQSIRLRHIEADIHTMNTAVD